MLNIFTHIKNNSTWLLDNEVIVVFKTTWIFDLYIYPAVYYYVLKDKSRLFFIPRAEFLMNAQKYNIEEYEDNCSKV